MSAVRDALENEEYYSDATLFWLWPQRWTVPFNRASQKYEPFWLYIGEQFDPSEVRAEVVEPQASPIPRSPKGTHLYKGIPIEDWIKAGQLPAAMNPADCSIA